MLRIFLGPHSLQACFYPSGGVERPVRVFWEDKRGPVIRQGVPKRTWSTFGSRAESVPAKRAPLCGKSHAVSAFRESHAFGRRFKPASINCLRATDRLTFALTTRRPPLPTIGLVAARWHDPAPSGRALLGSALLAARAGI